MGGGSIKTPQQSPEEKALLRAQLLTLAQQDKELNERRKRILRGQYASFGSLLKSAGGKSSGSGDNGRIGLQPEPSRQQAQSGGRSRSVRPL